MNEYQFTYNNELYYTNITSTCSNSTNKVLKAASLFPSKKLAYAAVLDKTVQIENAEVYEDANGVSHVRGTLNGEPFCTEEPEATPIDEVINVVEEVPVAEETLVVEEESPIVAEEPEPEPEVVVPSDYADILKLNTVPWCQELSISPENVNPEFCKAHGWRYIRGSYVMDIVREGKRYIYDENKQQLTSLKLQ